MINTIFLGIIAIELAYICFDIKRREKSIEKSAAIITAESLRK